MKLIYRIALHTCLIGFSLSLHAIDKPTSAYLHHLHQQQQWESLSKQANICLMQVNNDTADASILRLYQAEASYRLNDFTQAASSFTRIQYSDLTIPERENYKALQVMIEASQNKLMAAISHGSKFVQIYPNSSWSEEVLTVISDSYYTVGNKQAAIQLLAGNEIILESPVLLSKLLRLYLDSNQMTSAENTMLYLLEHYPKSLESEYGVCLYLSHYTSVRDFTKVVKWNRYTPETKQYVDTFHYYKALAYIGLNEDKLAISELDSIRPTTFLTEFTRASILYGKNPLDIKARSIVSKLKELPKTDIIQQKSALLSLQLEYVNQPQELITILLSNRENFSSIEGERLFLLGWLSAKAGFYDKALPNLISAQSKNISYELQQRSHILIAYCYKELSMDTTAQLYWTEHKRLFPDSPYIPYCIFEEAKQSLQSKEFDRAEKQLLSLVRSYNQSYPAPYAHYELGELYMKQGRLADAVLQMQAAATVLQNEQAIVLRIAQLNFLLEKYDQASKAANSLLKPEYQFDKYMILGNVAFNRRNYKVAQTNYTTASSFSRNKEQDNQAKSQCALTMYQMQQYKEASSLFQQLSHDTEENGSYQFLAAESAFQAGDFIRAITLNESYLSQHPTGAHAFEAKIAIADAHYNLGNFRRASLLYMDYIQSTPPRKFWPSILYGCLWSLSLTHDSTLMSQFNATVHNMASSEWKQQLQSISIQLAAKEKSWTLVSSLADELPDDTVQSLPVNVLQLIAEARTKSKAFDKAESIYQHISQSDSLSANIFIDWASMLLAKGDSTAALNKLAEGRTVLSNNELVLPYFDLLEKTNTDRFNKEINEIIQTKSDQYTDELKLLQLRSLVTHGDVESAIPLADTLSQSDDRFMQARVLLLSSRLFIQAAEYTEAINALEQYPSLFPEYSSLITESLYYRIIALSKANREQEAKQLLQENSGFFNSAQKYELEVLLSGVSK